jgi:hypothetical protein
MSYKSHEVLCTGAWVVPVFVLCPWMLVPTAGTDSTTSQGIADASTAFSLELLQVLASVKEIYDKVNAHLTQNTTQCK